MTQIDIPIEPKYPRKETEEFPVVYLITQDPGLFSQPL